MGYLAAQGAILAIGIVIGLICSVIGLFFGHIILFDSIALGIAAPTGNISERVIRSIQPEVLAHRKGDAFRLHLTGTPVWTVLHFLRWCVQINVMQLCVGNLVD